MLLSGTNYVALRKESVDRNLLMWYQCNTVVVALRKESVDRNKHSWVASFSCITVALRKESVDRNQPARGMQVVPFASLSARRAWIEILYYLHDLVPQ